MGAQDVDRAEPLQELLHGLVGDLSLRLKRSRRPAPHEWAGVRGPTAGRLGPPDREQLKALVREVLEEAGMQARGTGER